MVLALSRKHVRRESASVQTRPIVGEEDGIRGVRGVVFYAGDLAGGDAGEMQPLFEAGDVLRGFVRDAGNRIRVVEKPLRGVRRQVRMMFGEGVGTFGVPIRRWSRGGLVLRYFEHLAFDDAAHAIQVGAALPFEFALILGLLLQPKDHAYGRQDDESRQRKKVVPIGEQAFQSKSMLAQGGRRASLEIGSEARQSMGGFCRDAAADGWGGRSVAPTALGLLLYYGPRPSGLG